MSTTNWMRDPTAETSVIKRPRKAPPKSLDGLTIGLFDIGKTRTPEFLDRVEKRLNAKGLKTKRYGKPTNTKVATAEILQKVASEAVVVLIGLSD